MGKSLERLIEERRKEAKGKNFFEKALKITDYLGHSRTKNNTQHNYYFDGLFEINSFELDLDNGLTIIIGSEWGTKITYRGGLVFYGDRCHSDVYSYVPGEWEKEFEQLYRKAKRLKKRKKRTDFRVLDRNLIKAKWGL